jgi:hypothetical protein
VPSFGAPSVAQLFLFRRAKSSSPFHESAPIGRGTTT